ncbi:Ig-like domain-containing protein [Microbacterium sp.]|uniref:Ig-like domain-containing protein n=1 Tax=Microbacterium sp. TaxID=51671 RepID=UPI0039E58A52
MRRGTAAGLISAGAVLALVAGASVVWPGLDAQQTPPQVASAWVLQADGLRYARVNTAIGELDTVRSVSNPSRIVTTSTGAYMFTDSDAKRILIDDAVPVDLDTERLQSAATAPSGATEIATAGDFVAYRTDSGAVYAGRLSTGSLNPMEGPDAQETGDTEGDRTDAGVASDAIAVDARGILFSYSADAGTVVRFDIASGEVRGTDSAAAIDAPTMTAAGDAWVLVDTATGRFVTADGEGSTDTTGTIAVSRPDPDGTAVYLADETGLVRIDTDDGTAERVFGDSTTARGTPARPVVQDGTVYAAWLAEGAGPGTLWTSAAGDVTLDYAGQTLSTQRRPVFVQAGDGMILNDARSGWVWSVPSGALLPSSQDWDLEDRVDTAATTNDQEPPAVIDPRPPVAENDAFGVRAGALVTLPVLLNDHDPNEDVLAVEASSVAGLDPAFGALTTTDDRQRLAVRVAADATGTATFTYAVSDGTSDGGLLSQPATVTLRVVPEDENSAPVWCGVDGCQQDWPSPEVAPGGTVSLPVLGDWVDPDGDPIILLSAVDESGLGQVATTPEGDVVFQHVDSGDDGEQVASVALTVADTRGAASSKNLVVRVRDAPQPQLQSFAVVDTAGDRLTVDVASHVTGTAGDLTITAARVLDDAEATATVVGGSTQFDFAAAAAGAYRVAVTVSAGGVEATGTVRITLLPPDAPAGLSTAPVVAFVRPQADATVDVFAAVSNPTGRVLLLSDVVVHAAAGSSLKADAVGQSQLRVSGSTASGESGVLGTVSYRVSDGTADEGSQVTGEATVYLLPPAAEQAPIAVDDTVVVRAGAQIDIPVLDNDVAAPGARPRLDPESIESSSADALAFASGDVLRYLAPDTPGQYTIGYRAFTTGSPALGDIATVRVRVVGDDANREPLPGRLSGRVLSGLSTTISVDGFGMDPDGDVVRLDRIVDQPSHGTAMISADGTSIVYTSIAGTSGQDTFTYRVVDPYGATGIGTVRIGVLSGDANPSPITYTDYVHVQAGADSVIRVHPLANDLDPMRGTLTLTAVTPDLPEYAQDGTPSEEYARLKERIISMTDDTVTIAAGDAPGTMTFLYDVTSSSGNTAQGLLVVRVVAQRVPDFPVVEDTVLTADTRDDLARGVDVLSGKVLWSGGEAADLTVGLWDGAPADGISVVGGKLRGDVGDGARIIPFSVTGETASGTVTTYAFLRIPAASDVALALRAGAAPVTVGEGEQTDFDLAALVALPRGSTLEVGPAVRASGARANATCTATTGTTVRYVAGADAPWVDACLVQVRLAGQSNWTVLSVPITVVPVDPQPILAPASLEVSPGQTYVYDLTSLTTWHGSAEAIAYRVEDTAASFDVTLEGTQLTVRGRDDALPGTVEVVMVEVTSHSGVAPARMTLRVGAAPSALPQGGTVSHQCSQAGGSSCAIDVIGATGEVNPLPATPLQVVSVAATSTCAGVTFSVASATRIVASWTADAPGATCTATFTVRDAQGRQSAGSRDGRLVLDLQGYPLAPASIAQSAYGNGTLTLRVDPGAAQTAYPAVTGFEVRQGGQTVAQCSAQGVCPAVAAPNGEQRVYEAFAVNAVGTSRQSVSTTAWAYDPPAAPTSVSARPVVAGSDGGVAALTMTGVDVPDTSALIISSPTGETQTVTVAADQTTVSVPTFRVGSNTATPVTVTPVSRYDVPPGLPGPVIGSTIVQANGIGAPTGLALTLSAVNTGNGLADITATGAATPGGDGATVRFGIVREGQECQVSTDGPTRVFRGLADGRAYTFVLCVESWYDGVSYGRATTSAEVRAVQSGQAPTGYRFVVGPTAHVGSGRSTWTIDTAPTSSERIPNDNVVAFSGWPTSIFDTDPQIRVRYEHTSGWWQSAWGTVTPASGSAPYQVQASWSLGVCTGGGSLAPTGSSTGSLAAISFSADDIVYLDASGAVLPTGSDPWVVPDTATQVSGIRVVVDWSARGWNLDAASAELSGSCTPAPTPTDPAEETP